MSDKKPSKGYRDTLNLPQTSFSMKANLVQREPQQRKAWAEEAIYRKILAARAEAPLYVLHDGPPYANGDIHMGHVINKVLKDMVVKHRTMMGYRCPYVPGWDCHGLPIEIKVMGELGDAACSLDKPTIRKKCQSYALKFVKKQTDQFECLGVFGDFDDPYLTLNPDYEKAILEIFAELVGNGLVYRQLKPIHWSVGCETALADAELEYKDIASPSITVNFPLEEESVERLRQHGLVPEGEATVCLMIWTTTPWTLAANLAVAVHPVLDYVTITYEKDGRRFCSLVCAERAEAVAAMAGLQAGQYQRSQPIRGQDLAGLRYRHPFVEGNPTDHDAWFVITAEFVTTEDGTGLVHVAPGHGVEDYVAGQQNGLAVYSPVKDDGCYDDTVPGWLRGKSVLEVDREVNDHLRKAGWLVAESEILHSYPHCWRSKMPVIFRATEQWFISVDRVIPSYGKSLRQMALDSLSAVQWVPAWGEKRIRGMLESRPDWCISRQRAWGLPIPSIVNAQGRSLLETERGKQAVLAIAEYIGRHGSNAWFTDAPRQILGEDFPLPEGFTWDDLSKEENIFDVWFESGCSWHGVASRRGWPLPVDMYLEGSDQHRGWFQLSLLPALGSIGKAPFKTVLTHGFTVDEKGMKQAKSLGNYVNALEEVGKYGADILRLWVASVNYQEDMRCSDELIGRLQDAYRKIRNTLRYLLGNIDDFDPAAAVPYEKMPPIDRWAMQELRRLIEQVRQAYDGFAFHRVFALLYSFCTVQMSSLYLDVLKDRLYCDGQASLSRRSAQTVLHRILGDLVRMLAPILVHTAEEAWTAMAHKPEPVDSVHMAHLPEPDSAIDTTSEAAAWDKIMALRDEVLRVLEGLRKDQTINSNQEATVAITLADPELYELISDFGTEAFAALCITSEVTVEKGPAFEVRADKSRHPKCQRCWNYWPTVGQIDGYPDLCRRCADVVQTLHG